MPASYPIWSTKNPPHTSKSAAPKGFRIVTDATVIKVSRAKYRNSNPLNGCFEVVNLGVPTKIYKSKLRSEVYCSWFSIKPPTVFPQILLQTPGCTWNIIYNYSGEVIDNLEG